MSPLGLSLEYTDEQPFIKTVDSKKDGMEQIKLVTVPDSENSMIVTNHSNDKSAETVIY